MPPSESSFRVSIVANYYRIAAEQLRVCEEASAELASVGKLSDSAIDTFYRTYQKRAEAVVIGITFAAMSLEAFFYDYAATSLGERYTIQHLDKLDLPSKLVIIPKLVCGHQVERGSDVFGRVKSLTKYRNKLVHFKSTSFEYGDIQAAEKHMADLIGSLTTESRRAVGTVELVFKTLGSLEGAGDKYFTWYCSGS